MSRGEDRPRTMDDAMEEAFLLLDKHTAKKTMKDYDTYVFIRNCLRHYRWIRKNYGI